MAPSYKYVVAFLDPADIRDLRTILVNAERHRNCVFITVSRVDARDAFSAVSK
jgi:hypothetical protein